MNEQIELTHSMAHYLLTIHQLKEKKGYARVTDIAKELKLTKGSVSTAINNLKKRELVLEEDGCKFLLLTEAGHEEVHKILSSRRLLYLFLTKILDVTPEVADHDSCMMEHLLSPETREKFFNYLKESTCEKGDHFECNVHNDCEKESSLCRFSDSNDFIEKQDSDLSFKE